MISRYDTSERMNAIVTVDEDRGTGKTMIFCATCREIRNTRHAMIWQIMNIPIAI